MDSSKHLPLPLVVRRPLLEGESLASFVQRHCEENVIPSIRDFLRLVEAAIGAAVRDISGLARQRESLYAVEALTGLAPGALSHLYLTALTGVANKRTEIRFRQGAHEWAAASRSQDIQLLCTACLRDSGHARATWEFAQAPVCTVHSSALTDICPSCDAALRFNRTALTSCTHCGHDLRTSSGPRPRLDASTVSAALLVQRPRMVALGDDRYTAPIDASELSLLLRLCLHPRLGEDTDYGLVNNMESHPIERRLEALTRLGTALVADRIDSARLRSALLERWPYAKRLPRRDQLELLAHACSTLELPLDVVSLLCHGREHEPRTTAAELFGGKPPSLNSAKQLASFLDVDDKLLRELCALEQVSLDLEAGFGYDMDTVLRLRASHLSIFSFEEADVTFGRSGLTAELVDMKLLRALPTAPECSGVHPAHIAGLFARLHQCIVVNPGHRSEAVPLLWGESLGYDNRRLAWAVAQILGGSLPAIGWDSPFSIMSLVVCEHRLTRLATWPTKEVAECQQSLPAQAAGSPAEHPVARPGGVAL